MKKVMELCARCTVLIVIVVLAFMVHYISKMDYVRTEETVIEDYNGNISFNQTSEGLSYKIGSVIDIETGKDKFEDVKVSDIIYTDTYIGNKQVVKCVTDKEFAGSDGLSKIYLKYDSFFNYITESNLSRRTD